MKKKYFFLFPFLFIFFSVLNAQKLNTRDLKESKHSSPEKIFSLSRSLASHSFDVLHYKLDIRFPLTDNTFTGKMTITSLGNQASLNSLSLNCASLTVDTVRRNGIPLSYSTANDLLDITLDRTFTVGDTIQLEIDYHGSGNYVGYFYYPQNLIQNILENIGYTMSEPSDARYWMPCYDQPDDKATCEINVTVPYGYLAASNGLLLGTVDNGNGTQTFHWQETHPIATYLMCATMSRYSTFSNYYKRISNPTDSIEVKYYVWNQDVTQAQTVFSTVPEMIRFFSSYFGEYPFSKYGMAAVFPFYYGGMEHQTMTTIHRNWILGNSQYGIAHELAHQWWGDWVTCGTWADIWLNEGFASYAEALWYEHLYGPARLKEYLYFYFSNYFDPSWQYPIYGPPPGYLFGDAVYSKAAYVLHMLRHVVGDSIFQQIFKTYGNNFAYGNAVTQDFQNTASTIAGRDLTWFFQEWIYQAGYPDYHYQWNAKNIGNGYQVQMIVRQAQAGAGFTMPIDFYVHAAPRDTTLTLWVDQKNDTLNFTLNGRPSSIEFDREVWVLKTVTQGQSFVDDQLINPPAEFQLYQNHPNPFNLSTTIEYDLPQPGYVRVEIFNPLGQKVRTLDDGYQLPGYNHLLKWDSTNDSGKQVTSGIYFYKIELTDGNKILFRKLRKMVLLK